MDTKRKDTVLDVPEKKGQYLVFVFIFISLFEVLVFSPIMGVFDVGRLLLTAVLVFLVYEGYNWARILAGVLAGLAGVLGIYGLLVSGFGKFGNRTGLVLLMLVLYFVMMAILLFSQNAIAFLEDQKVRMKS